MIEHAYIHIPFCTGKCYYCAFVSNENFSDKKEYLKALKKEIGTRYKGEALKTLYFGGGTPSMLEVSELEELVNCFNFTENPEITIEVNPETVSAKYFNGLKKTKVNRISLGVQSFDDNILKLIGRRHNVDKVYESIKIIKNAGFENISIDLIYGLPAQTPQMFERDVEKALKLDITHLSSYGLKIEENSYFGKNLPENLPDDELQAQMFLLMCEKLKQNGFEHYEISNFAKKGFESQHNCAYWRNKEYYGFGLNASGYEGNVRYKNTSFMEKYLSNPLLKEEENELPKQEIMENEIFLALRLKHGIDIAKFNKKYNIDFIEKYLQILEKYKKNEMLEIIDDRCKLTEKGLLLSNEIMCEFLDV